MIVDLERFARSGRGRWDELEREIERLEADPARRLTLPELDRLHSLYQEVCADLARVAALPPGREPRNYLESLVARAYCEIHEERGRKTFSLRRWFWHELPAAFQRNVRAFHASVALTILGMLFGMAILQLDPEAKEALVPFRHTWASPKERVAREMKEGARGLEGHKATFAARLMTNNIRVSLLALALGMTFGVGTFLLLFYNGVVLGVVALDYILAGESVFLAGWLLPHGSTEIPAILIGGQAGLMLGHALMGWGSRAPRSERLRRIAPDVVTLAGGVVVLLLWAGVVESYLSQYHEPVIPYAAKIAFGAVNLAALIAFLRKRAPAS